MSSYSHTSVNRNLREINEIIGNLIARFPFCTTGLDYRALALQEENVRYHIRAIFFYREITVRADDAIIVFRTDMRDDVRDFLKSLSA